MGYWQLRYLNLDRIAEEFSKVKNCITFIFNHSSTEFNPCEGPLEDKIVNEVNLKSFYDEDVQSLDFKKEGKVFEGKSKLGEGLAVLVNLNLGK